MTPSQYQYQRAEDMSEEVTSETHFRQCFSTNACPFSPICLAISPCEPSLCVSPCFGGAPRKKASMFGKSLESYLQSHTKHTRVEVKSCFTRAQGGRKRGRQGDSLHRYVMIPRYQMIREPFREGCRFDDDGAGEKQGSEPA